MTSKEFLGAICSQVLCHKQPVPSQKRLMGFTKLQRQLQVRATCFYSRFGQDHMDDESDFGASLAKLIDQLQHSLLRDLGPAA